jgi:deoxyribonuclease-4
MKRRLLPRDLLGAHMSIAGGLHRAILRGQEVGCSVVQIFLKNQLRWTAAPYAEAEVREFKAAWRATGIGPIFAHGSYLLNLATPDPAEWRRAVAALRDEVERAGTLGLPFVVVHPGSHRGAGADPGIRRIARALDAVADGMPGDRAGILLENTAGAGDTIGRSFEELARILDHVRAPERVGICLDTCHLFAAGYDIRSREGYEACVDRCARVIGLGRVRAIHVNDAKAPLGSGLDRHEQIGKGALGVGPFAWLVRDRRFAKVPMVLETPKEPEPQADREALALLRRLRYRERPIPTRGQRRATGQIEQRGETGRHTFWPKATRRSL